MRFRRALPGAASPTPRMPLWPLELLCPSAPRNQQCSHDAVLSACPMPGAVRADNIRNYLYLNDFKIHSQPAASANTASSEHPDSLFHQKTVDLKPPIPDPPRLVTRISKPGRLIWFHGSDRNCSHVIGLIRVWKIHGIRGILHPFFHQLWLPDSMGKNATEYGFHGFCWRALGYGGAAKPCAAPHSKGDKCFCYNVWT